MGYAQLAPFCHFVSLNCWFYPSLLCDNKKIDFGTSNDEASYNLKLKSFTPFWKIDTLSYVNVVL